jgi:uncharacterized protein (DUF1697 family)
MANQLPSVRHIALLRGINVGGNNIIKMADLKACFESMRLRDVATYIQSGNVLFSSDESDRAKLTKKIENALSKRFDYESTVVVVTGNQLKEVVADAPPGFGQDLDQYRYDVLFLKQPLEPKKALESISVRAGVDAAYAGNGVLYFSRLVSKLTLSHLNKMVALPIYKRITIRNWNTASKLHALVNS